MHIYILIKIVYFIYYRCSMYFRYFFYKKEHNTHTSLRCIYICVCVCVCVCQRHVSIVFLHILLKKSINCFLSSLICGISIGYCSLLNTRPLQYFSNICISSNLYAYFKHCPIPYKHIISLLWCSMQLEISLTMECNTYTHDKIIRFIYIAGVPHS